LQTVYTSIMPSKSRFSPHLRQTANLPGRRSPGKIRFAETTRLAPPRRQATFLQSFFLKLTIIGLFCLIHYPPNALAATPAPEEQLEELSRFFLEKPSPSTRAALLRFCQSQKNSRSSTLGYFLIGLREFQDEKYKTADQYLGKANVNSVVIADYLLYYHAATLCRMGRAADSLEKLNGWFDRYPFSPFWDSAQQVYLENALLSGQPELILDHFKKYNRRAEIPENLYWKARALEMRGEPAETLSLYQRLYFEFPLFAKDDAVFQRLQLLAAETPVSSTVSPELQLARAEKLIGGRQYSKALIQLKTLPRDTLPSHLAARHRLWQGIGEYRTGRLQAAAVSLENFNSGEEELDAQAAYYLAEVFKRQGEFRLLRECLESLEKNWPRSKWLEEVLFSLGNHFLVKRDLIEATKAYEKLVSCFPSGKHAQDAHWRVAWQQYRLGNYQAAADFFLNHLKRFNGSGNSAAALYWYARSLDNLNRREEAQLVYRTMVHRFSHSYYGQLSQERLNHRANLPASANPPNPLVEEILARFQMPKMPRFVQGSEPWLQMSMDAWPRVKELVSIQLFELAAREILEGKEPGETPQAMFQAARLFYQGRSFQQAILTMRRAIPDSKELPLAVLPAEAWQILFPVHYLEQVVQETKRNSLDPYLVLPLILQESAFNPRALSRANAHGLMQVVPATGRLVARQLRLRRPSPAQMFDPSLNLRLGSAFFASLLREFDGAEEKALASYNAGPDRVRAWAAEGKYADAAEFIESIPFSETRSYVKIILRDRWFYKRLYGNLAAQPAAP
jgi:soluble lytic murein transglycosylase